MVTEYSVNGMIRIDPPLKWQDIQLSPYLPSSMAGADRGRSLVLVLDGAVGAVGIVCRWGETTDPNDLVAELQSIVDDRPGRQYVGFLDLEDEKRADLQRIAVIIDVAVTFYVQDDGTWPEGAE